MSIRALLTPINLVRPTESLNLSTVASTPPLVLLLVLPAFVATFGISAAPSATTRLCECGVFLFAGILLIRPETTLPRSWPLELAIVALISFWGFGQLAVNATEYRYATFDAALRTATLGATLVSACRVLAGESARTFFIKTLASIGFAISVISVLAYHTSPGKILWVFDSTFPDAWGPFLNRNNFAQFLELTFPACLWLGLTRRHDAHLYLAAAAFMLAAGIASASRTGALLLIVETGVAFWIANRTRRAWWFSGAAALLIAIVGAGVLAGRFAAGDFLEFRREIFRSTMSMISAKPWHGYGLGNYSTVYPEFAEFDSGAVVEHAHNDWLEWTAEGGIAYAGLWIVFAIRLAPPAIRSIWGLGVPAVFLHACVDYPFARLGIGAWVFSIAGAVLAQRKPSVAHH